MRAAMDLKFAVVREDPLIEAAVLPDKSAPSVLLVASGGCTALALQALRPDARFTLVDPNPAQLAHVRRKVESLGRPVFNVGDDDRNGLSECGQFESLFRSLRSFLAEFVGPRPDPAHRYWPVAFELFFSDAMLVAMFGPDAVQHAAPGSYPQHFRAAVERALGTDNPFLDHILHGCYRNALPAFLTLPHPPAWNFDYRLGMLEELPSFAEYDLVHLSNVPDWIPRERVTRLARRVAAELRPGARLTIRQLNNRVPIEADFPGVVFDDVLGDKLLARDRSLFYDRILVGEKR